MKDILKTQDPVKLSFAADVLQQAGIGSVVLDDATAGLYGGGLPFIQRRLAVADEDAHQARTLLAAAFRDVEQSSDEDESRNG